MTNMIPFPNNGELPEHLRGGPGLSESVAQGIQPSMGPQLSFRGSRWRIRIPGQDEQVLPNIEIDVIVVGANPAVCKVLYKDDFSEETSDAPPACFSNDGKYPDSMVVAPAAPNCIDCDNNKRGSAISKISGKPIKACSDVKRIAVIPNMGELGGQTAFGLGVPAASLQNLAEYARTLAERGLDISKVVTRLGFDPSAGYPKITFKPVGLLDAPSWAAVAPRLESQEIVHVTRQDAQPALPAPTPETVQGMEDVTAPVAEFMPPAAVMPEQTPVPAAPPIPQQQAAPAWFGQPAAPTVPPVAETAQPAFGTPAPAPEVPAASGWGGAAAGEATQAPTQWGQPAASAPQTQAPAAVPPAAPAPQTPAPQTGAPSVQVDNRGVIFDPEIHATAAAGGPSILASGAFRKKKGVHKDEVAKRERKLDAGAPQAPAPQAPAPQAPAPQAPALQDNSLAGMQAELEAKLNSMNLGGLPGGS